MSASGYFAEDSTIRRISRESIVRLLDRNGRGDGALLRLVRSAATDTAPVRR